MRNTVGKVFAIIFGILALVYVLGALAFTQVYMPNTSVNGADISLMPKNQLKESFKNSWKDYTLTINGRGDKKDTISAKDIDYVETMPSFKEKGANPWGWPVLAFVRKDFKVATTIDYSDEKLENKLAYLHMVTDGDITDPVPQQIAYADDKGYYIADAKPGTRVDGPKLKRAVLASFHKQDKVMDADKAKVYLEAAPAEDLDHMKNHVASMNEIEGFTLKYNFSDREETLGGQDLIQLYKQRDDGSLEPDEAKIKTYVANLAQKYDTFRGTREFQATGGAMMRIQGGIYGWQIDQKETRKQLLEAINKKQSQTMEPVYKRKAQSRNVNDLGNSYIEIDIARQHMWLYKDGNLVVESPVVTGNPYQGNGTPTGTQEVWMKERNRYLTGETWKSYVKYWMPFNWTGCGIHDANWRGSFGGKIYLGGGSHGCVNTPSKKAAIFYENAFEGMPVIVYNSSKHAI